MNRIDAIYRLRHACNAALAKIEDALMLPDETKVDPASVARELNQEAVSVYCHLVEEANRDAAAARERKA